jgi:dihydroorotate dehydrogenase
MYSLIRSLLFRLSAEHAHVLVMRGLKWFPLAGQAFARRVNTLPELSQTLWGIPFPHPIGLAAGLDKDAIAVDGLFSCGFAFVEVGTVTPKAQPGNPKPRLFRLKQDLALINRMGFNNEGSAALQKHLSMRRKPGIVGINLGKNKMTPNDQAVDDYTQLVSALYTFADYLVINVSSPNTPGLRDLQSESTLVPLVKEVIEARNDAFKTHHHHTRKPPVLVKLSPDLSDEAVFELGKSLAHIGVDGFIATNTTIQRNNLKSAEQAAENGGLSGKPLQSRSTEVIRILYRATGGQVPIIGSGGVMSVTDAYEKILAGASLIQIYTGFIYYGPPLIGELVEGLHRKLQEAGYGSITEAIGQGVRSSQDE